MVALKFSNGPFYFAYGSNMLIRRLAVDGRAPSAKPVTVGYVTGRRLVFDKVGKDGSGKCDAEKSASESDRVYGVVFRMATTDKERLDRIEGLGGGYAEEPVEVQVAGGSLEALTYVATRKSDAVRPFEWYKALVLAGAEEHGLPETHIEKIRAVETIPDPCAQRLAENVRLLSNR